MNNLRSSASSPKDVEGLRCQPALLEEGTDSIFIPSMNLVILNNGRAYPSDIGIESKEALKNTQKIPVSFNVAKNINALVQQKLELKEKQKETDALIAVLAKRLFE